MSEDIDLLKFVCSKLENAGIEYMLTGSLASNFYAIPRMTRDIDIVIALEKIEINKFCRFFEKDFYLSRSAISEAIEHQNMFNIIHNDSVFKVDFMIRKDLDYRNIEFQRRNRINLDGSQIWIVSPEDLIISKLFWAKDSFSELQIKGVKNLFASLKDLDQKYISHWVQKLGLELIFDKVKTNE